MNIDNKCEISETFQERIYKFRGMHIVSYFEKVQQFCIRATGRRVGNLWLNIFNTSLKKVRCFECILGKRIRFAG